MDLLLSISSMESKIIIEQIKGLIYPKSLTYSKQRCTIFVLGAYVAPLSEYVRPCRDSRTGMTSKSY